ncbi:MAG: uncharacterized protein Dbin4_01517, partial [Alphaproteobacteria bacterium]|nr:uncharacterized protein [Alphaproteobacteria bacterium]
MSKQPKFSPAPTPETQHYWDGTKRGELLIQQCDACAAHYFPPRPFCPKCASRKVSVKKASGKATLYSYVISHQQPAIQPRRLGIGIGRQLQPQAIFQIGFQLRGKKTHFGNQMPG